jgi:putative membrane protein
LTLGLFILVINAVMFWLAAAILPGVAVASFFGAFLGALVVSVVSFVVNKFI